VADDTPLGVDQQDRTQHSLGLPLDQIDHAIQQLGQRRA